MDKEYIYIYIYIYMNITHSSKRIEILPFAATWMELDEISQSEKDKDHMISLICGIYEAK